MAQINFFKKEVNNQDQGHKLKNFGTNRKVLLRGIHMRNMNALSSCKWRDAQLFPILNLSPIHYRGLLRRPH